MADAFDPPLQVLGLAGIANAHGWSANGKLRIVESFLGRNIQAVAEGGVKDWVNAKKKRKSLNRKGAKVAKGRRGGEEGMKFLILDFEF